MHRAFQDCICGWKRTIDMPSQNLRERERDMDGGFESSLLSHLEKKLNRMWNLFFNDDRIVACPATVWKDILSGADNQTNWGHIYWVLAVVLCYSQTFPMIIIAENSVFKRHLMEHWILERNGQSVVFFFSFTFFFFFGSSHFRFSKLR